MDYQVDIWRIAQAEILEAFAHYEKLRPILGSDFLKAVDEYIELIRINPTAYQLVYKNVRRVRLSRFAYSLIYFISDDVVFIAGCVHGSRDPSSWQERIE